MGQLRRIKCQQVWKLTLKTPHTNDTIASGSSDGLRALMKKKTLRDKVIKDRVIAKQANASRAIA